MARRFDQLYRVKPRDNLGDPEYWNRRFEDVDRRVSSTEDGLEEIGGLTAYIEGLALDRLNLVLSPALDKISLVSNQGFLLAHSISTVTLNTATTQTFVIDNAAERELFAPSPFVTLTRAANITDYAFCRTISWSNLTGELVLQPIQIFGNSGPFSDWAIYVGSAVSQAVQAMLADTQAARDAALGYRNTANADAAATAADRTAVSTMKTDAQAARDAAQGYAAAAQTWDPAGYYTKTAVDTKFTNLINGAGPALDTLKELADALGNDDHFSTTVTASLGNRLRVDAAQGLSSAQQIQGRENLGIFWTKPLPASANFNTQKTSGSYYTVDGSSTNAPTAEYYYLEVLGYTDPAYVGQRATNISTGAVYIRAMINNVWQAWRQVLTAAGNQLISGGFSVTTYNAGNVGGTTFTPNPANGNYQYAINNAAFTLAAPTVDCAIDLLLYTNTGAGAVTFSGFTVSSIGTGDPLTTSVGYYHIISIRRLVGVSTYTIKRING